MHKQEFPDGSIGEVYGPDGPVRRTRANVVAGFIEPVRREATFRASRSQAFLDEEGAWLNNPHFEE